jgi:hypothetical protein
MMLLNAKLRVCVHKDVEKEGKFKGSIPKVEKKFG